MTVIKTSKKPKILIFIGVHPGLKFAPFRFVQFVPRFVARCGYIVMLRARMFRSLIPVLKIKERNIRARNIAI